MDFDKCATLLKKLHDKARNQEYSENENYETIEIESNEVFVNLIRFSVTEKKYFSSSPLEVYTLYLNEELKAEEKESLDFDEIQYLKKEYQKQSKILNTQRNSASFPFYRNQLNDENYNLFQSILKKRITYLEKFLFKKGIEVILSKPYPYKVNIEFKTHINTMVENDNSLPTKPQHENTLNWTGEQTEFIELFKALLLNGSITGTGNQEDKINQLANILNFKINNPYKLLNDIKTTRNNGSETLFLDKLKKTFFNYITLEKKK
jgi:hypothetical protein